MSKENIAKPHTIKKFELIEQYVVNWAPKILNYKGRDGFSPQGIVYIDCMSSSGMYKTEDGKPVKGTALRVVDKLKKIMPDYPSKKALLFFNDIDNDKIELLKCEIEKEQLENIKNIEMKYNVGDCNDFLRKLNLGDFEGYNTLLLYDPYKAAIDWQAVDPFFQHWGEVIINHMVFDTARGASQAKRPETIDRYQKTYQKRIEAIITLGRNKTELNKVVLDIIENQKKDSRREYFLASFPFFNRTNGLLYNLIHYSTNIEGFKLFKRVAWKTFGDKSSIKNTHGNEKQMEFDFVNSADEECYCIRDIAKYLFDRYSGKVITKGKIWQDLDCHPIFPSDGYRSKIREELKKYFNVTLNKKGNFMFPSG